MRCFAVVILVLIFASSYAFGQEMSALGDPPGREPAATQPSKRAAERAEKLKADVKIFTLSLEHHGALDVVGGKPYYRLLLSVQQPMVEHRFNPFHLSAQITEGEAKAIIDYLAVEGFLEKAMDGTQYVGPFSPEPQYPCYALKVQVWSIGDPITYEQSPTLDLKMLQRLDGLRKVLKGDAAKGMDLLLERMSGQRKEWEQQATTQQDAREAR